MWTMPLVSARHWWETQLERQEERTLLLHQNAPGVVSWSSSAFEISGQPWPGCRDAFPFAYT